MNIEQWSTGKSRKPFKTNGQSSRFVIHQRKNGIGIRSLAQRPGQLTFNGFKQSLTAAQDAIRRVLRIWGPETGLIGHTAMGGMMSGGGSLDGDNSGKDNKYRGIY